MFRVHRAAFLLVFLGVAAGLVAAEGIKVNRSAPVVEHKTFNREHPPADMPPLEPKEAAVTKSVFGIATQFSVQVISDEKRGGKTVAKVKVTNVILDLSLKITVWVPTDAPKTIIDHEEGHRQISEYFYKDAEKIARNIAQKYVGQVFEAEGNDAESASRAALIRRSTSCRRNIWPRRRMFRCGRMRFLMRLRSIRGTRRFRLRKQ